MSNEKMLQNILLRVTLGAGLVLLPVSLSAAALAPANIVVQDPDPVVEDESQFYDRDALATILFGDSVEDLAAALSTLEADLGVVGDEITQLEGDLAAATAEGSTATQEDIDAIQLALDGKTEELAALTDLDSFNNLSDEQVFALNRSFNGWVNNSFDVSLSDELMALLLSGDLNDQQVRFAIKAEFEGVKFNSLADRMEEKGLTTQAQRMRDRGETQKARFGGKVDSFSDESAGIAQQTAQNSAQEAAKSAAKGSAKEDARGAAKNQAKFAAKSAAKNAARESAKENAKNAAKDRAKNMGRGNN